VDFSYRTSDDMLETITTDGFGSTTLTTTGSYPGAMMCFRL